MDSKIREQMEAARARSVTPPPRRGRGKNKRMRDLDLYEGPRQPVKLHLTREDILGQKTWNSR